MPIVHYTLPLLRKLLTVLDNDPESVKRIATLSYPDIIAAPLTVAHMMKVDFKSLPYVADPQPIINWHKSHEIADKVVDTAKLFEMLGYQMTAIDKTEGRGGEFLHDLNTPLPYSLTHKYDLVFDIITNQCFHVAQAMITAAQLVRVGGYIFHQIPAQMVNQGFWNVSPAAYHDFYRVAPFEIVDQFQIVGVYRESQRLRLDVDRRVRNVPDDTMNIVIAKKTGSMDVYTCPMMSKFEKHPDCKK